MLIFCGDCLPVRMVKWWGNFERTMNEPLPDMTEAENDLERLHAANLPSSRRRFLWVLSLLAVVAIVGLVSILWQPAQFRQLKGQLKGINDVLFSPDGEFIATASDDASIRLWTPDSEFVRNITGHSDRVVCLAFSPAGDRLASGAGDGDIRIWDVATGIEMALLHETDESIAALTFDSSGTRLFAVGWHSALDVWDAGRGTLIEQIPLPASAESCVLISDESALMVGCTDGVVRVCDLSTKQIDDVLIGHDGGIKGLAIATDGDTVATSSTDRTLRLWSLSRRGSLAMLPSNAVVEDVAFCCNDRLLLSGTRHGHLHVTDVERRVRIANVPTPLDHVKSVCCGGNDRCAAGGYKALAILFSAERLLSP